jgi:hypothetical protein
MGLDNGVIYEVKSKVRGEQAVTAATLFVASSKRSGPSEAAAPLLAALE